MHVLVTGAGGYIGNVLVGELLDNNHQVTALDRFFFGEDVLAPYQNRPGFTLVRQDTRDITADQLKGIDVICDLAALSNDPCGDLDPALTCSVNLEARANLAAMGKRAGVKRYILASSCSVYGHGLQTELTEDGPTSPLTVYAKCNLDAERRALELAGPNYTVTALRSATVFGLSRRMRFDLVINLMTLHAVRNGRIFVMGGGMQWRPLVHIRDLARAYCRLLEVSNDTICGEVFNVGIQNYQALNLAYIVREALPFPLQVEVTPDDADKRTYSVSFRKLNEVLGFKPTITPAEGAREIYEALKNGSVTDDPRTSTVKWYRTILDAKALIQQMELNGRLL